jgi:hypothetical protein
MCNRDGHLGPGAGATEHDTKAPGYRLVPAEEVDLVVRSGQETSEIAPVNWALYSAE